MPDRAPAANGPLTSRPGRLALVVPDLVQLNRRFNLDDPFDRSHVYEIVLREAIRVDELVTWLDADILRQLWPDLYLPRGVRRAWELRHPELASLGAAA